MKNQYARTIANEYRFMPPGDLNLATLMCLSEFWESVATVLNANTSPPKLYIDDDNWTVEDHYEEYGI